MPSLQSCWQHKSTKVAWLPEHGSDLSPASEGDADASADAAFPELVEQSHACCEHTVNEADMWDPAPLFVYMLTMRLLW